ncbi:hypothetical protein LDL08_10955 [Nonomuraea glycinis]|uniref:Thiopeptide-type bacteriocin biosynthesis domain-containing protein n=1 Tax=Nonomuraea glycinis TaxID=2047744 RepID=A0A918E425_9ACTN|nr:thiopeptide maturation pyridine synthase [Nonomuraea glycinis]MCA2176702.1 hypothetical protein [Nonomuraea glycinis]GGP03482.1 hypothetical protein GCM10012278_14880 [Nonomuraea glycinis]
MDSAASWHSAYVYYYEKDKSGLLVDAVGPLLDRVAALTEAAFVAPHWRQGPHLRINVQAHAYDWSEVIRPAIEETIGAYLREHPSTARLDERSRLLQHRVLARQEREIGPLAPWYPDNTIRYPPFDFRRHVVGDQKAADLIMDFSVESNELYLDMSRHLREGRDRLDLLMLTMMFTTAHAVGGLRRNVGSFRAHAEGFLAACADTELWRSEFAAKYGKHRDVVVGRLREVIRALDGPHAAPFPFVREWAALVARHAERAGPIAESGLLTTSPAPGADFFRERGNSEYLRLALSNDAYLKRGLGNPVFLRYRVVLNYTYSFLTRMGVAPRERSLLCHLAADAIEDVYNVSAVGFLRKFVAEHPGAPAEPS